MIEKDTQTDTLSLKVLEKGAQPITLLDFDEERVLEKDTQTNTLLLKVHEKDAQTDTLLDLDGERVLVKDTQTDTLSLKVHGKGAQTHTLLGLDEERVLVKDTYVDTLSLKVLEKGAQTDHLSVHLLFPEALFLQGMQEASKRKHKHKDISLDNLDKEKKEERENLKKREIEGPENLVAEMYHRVCISFPRITQVTASRKEKIRRRLAEMGGLPVLENVFCKMEASAFLKGNNSKGWTANFDWVFENPDNWVKVIEGNYDNRTATDKGEPRISEMLQTDLSKF